MNFPDRTRRKRNSRQRRFHMEGLEARAMMTTVVHDLAADFSNINSPDNTVWSLHAGTQELEHQAEWPLGNLAEQPVWSTLNDGEIRPFKSASDLDFTGEFVYALNAGGRGNLTIGDARFTDGTIARDSDAITSTFENATWYPDASYGNTEDDNTLELVMQSIRWDRQPGFAINLDVEPGKAYKLQMLFAELWRERGWDIIIEGEEVVSDFIVYQEQGGINQKDTGVVYTREFIAADTEVNIRFTGDAGVVDTAPVINAFTLEKLHEDLGAPLWMQSNATRDEDLFDGFESNDILVRPALMGEGYGAANVIWTSPEDTMISVSGELWTMADGVGDFQWQIDLNDRPLSAGTLLANEFDRQSPFHILTGSHGIDALRNVPMEKGDELRLTIVGSQPEFVAVDLAVTADSSRIPRFPLGSIPTQQANSDSPIRFFVDVPRESRDSLRMHVSGLRQEDATAQVSLDASGLFTYVPDPNERFDVTIDFEAMVDGTDETQRVTMRTQEIRSEFDKIPNPNDMPDESDYVFVSEEVLNSNVYFNAREQSTRRVEIAAKHLNLIPGDENGVFERIVYRGGATNADIQELAIYAETVVIGGELRLPATDITIFAKELIFQDDKAFGSINTTPLSYTSAAANAQIKAPPPGSHLPQVIPGEDGMRGEDAGYVTLHVHSVLAPASSNPTAVRFVLRGGDGQQAGAGLPGQKGNSVRVIQPEDGLSPNRDPLDALAISNVLKSYPTATYIQWNDIFQDPSTIYGSKAFPTDGEAAIPGGRPGNGGTGGRLVSPFPELAAIADVSGGAAGLKAANQPGGNAGSPNNACQIEIPVIGNWGVTCRPSKKGANWTAPSGRSGSVGRVVLTANQNASSWLHPAALRSMISFAKDAYFRGHFDAASEQFHEFGTLLDAAMSSEFASQFIDMRTEVTALSHQLANQLDYFGNPIGWAPTLSFATNYLAFQQAIRSDLRTLYLARFVQRAEIELEARRASLNNLINELDDTIDRAVDDLNDAQSRLPDLQGDLQDIVVETEQIQSELTRLESDLQSQAQSNVAARNVLATIGGLLSVVPIPAVAAVGSGLSTLHNFVVDPSLGSFVDTAKGIADPFRQETLNATSQAISDQLAALQRGNASYRDYAMELGNLGAKWAPVVTAYREAAARTQVPSGEVEAELQKLKAGNPEYRTLFAKLASLLAKKQAYATELALTMNTIATSLNTMSSSYATADALQQDLQRESTRALSRASSDRIRELERSARDRLVRYQYNLAKAFEYETLQAYPGDFRLSKTFNEIVRLLDGAGDAATSWLDDPRHFASLQSVYESELSEVAEQVLEALKDTSSGTGDIKLSLSDDQLSELNRQGELTINLVEMGFINPARQEIRLLQMGVDSLDFDISSNGELQAANVQFLFEHSGQSVLQSEGRKYLFQHVASGANAFFWSTYFDALGGQLTQSEVSPSEIEAVSAVLGGRELGELRSPYAHPGAWADITIRAVKERDNFDMDIQDLTIFVSYDAVLPEDSTVLLNLHAPAGISPRVLLDRKDVTGRDDGDGSFLRFYNEGSHVVLTAEPTYGQLQFAGWIDDRGNKVSDAPALALTLTNPTTWLQATYKEDNTAEPIAGDADGNDRVDFADFLILSSNFARSGDVVFADGDFDASGTVDFADFLILSRTFGSSRTSTR